MEEPKPRPARGSYSRIAIVEACLGQGREADANGGQLPTPWAIPQATLRGYMPHELDRWLYSGGRPNRVAKFLNGIWRRSAAIGLPPRRLCELQVRGRSTGRLTSFPVVVADYEDERYVVAMLGEGANWVANVRAAGGLAVLRHGSREAVRLEELDSGARAPILQRYLQVAPGARSHVPVDRHAPLADFERIASQYPVFRVRAGS